MNADSQQLTLDANLVTAQDQPLSNKELRDCLVSALGADKCRIIKTASRRPVVEYKAGGKTYHLLPRSCTYLGNPHPPYKKRIQLPLWFNEYALSLKESAPEIDVRYIGVYHYDDNIVFIDFNKDTYLTKKGHNSSAHVYTNDLFQGMTYGIFSKTDKSGNVITVVRPDRFAAYLTGQAREKSLFELFEQFNSQFAFGQWLNALDAIKEMHDNGWHQWRQAEWAGWFLEYKFNKFATDLNLADKMRYVGSSLKRDGDLDFDIRFKEENFYGDLKASDISKKITPGNDQDNLLECISRFGKFWYVIFEHETVKDSAQTGFEATKARNRYIKSIDPAYDKDEMSYHGRMKNKVRFVKMSIIELNRINYKDALLDFHQGHQPDGSPRNLKFNIDKKVLENDNFVVFRYSYNQ